MSSSTPITPIQFLALCISGVILIIVAGRVLSMWFRYLLERHGDMGPPGHLGMAHIRREQRVLVGKFETPPGLAKVLAWILRVLGAVIVVAMCAIFYLTFSIEANEESSCIACLLDPSSKTPLFWTGYGLVVMWIVVPRLAETMVLRHDPRQAEEEGRFDIRRYRMGLRMIFTDHPKPTDPVALRLRTMCRWLLLLAIADALAMIVLLVLQR
jgi:hypothetical protein